MHTEGMLSLLLPIERRIGVRRITEHAVVHDIARLGDGVAPEWLSLYLEVLDRTIVNTIEGQC